MSHPSNEAVRIEAGERVERSEKYALMFPHLIGVNDLRFQDVNWQEDYLRRMYKMPPLVRKSEVNSEGEIVNKVEVDVNSRKAYMRNYMAKKRAAKRGDKV